MLLAVCGAPKPLLAVKLYYYWAPGRWTRTGPAPELHRRRHTAAGAAGAPVAVACDVAVAVVRATMSAD